MKEYNSYVDQNRLRREKFGRSQAKSKSMGKKSLSKRIIKERVDGITANNIDKEVERLALEVEIGELREQIIEHVRFYMTARPVTYDKNKIEEWAVQMRDLENQCKDQEIDAKEYLKGLLSIDKEIIDIITAWEQCQ